MAHRTRVHRGLRRVLLLLALAPGLAFGAGVAEARPRLVLVVSVDQLRPDRMGSELPGGLGRLAREGRVYTQAVQDHAMTETCPGHATLLTGRHPAAAGIPGNNFFDAERKRVVYCSDDTAADARVIGRDPTAPAEGRSPRLLRVDALGDWMQRANPEARVFAVGGKDRGAIMMGGQRPDGAYWFRGADLSFTTSTYYRPRLPAWAQRFNDPATGFLARVPDTWEHDTLAGDRPDDFPGESQRHSRTSGHPVRSEKTAEFAQRLFASPFVDDATLDFALELVEQEGLGRDDVPDLLGISLSATDVVGHHYGPFSQESRDALQRLDAGVGRLLEALEARVGKGRLLVALTADHGVLPLPEWLEAQGRAECPVDGGRVGLKRLGLGMLTRLHLGHSTLRWPRPWMLFAGTQMAVNRELAAARGADPRAVADDAEAYLERSPGIAEVWNPDEIRSGTRETARLYRNSYDPERSGDLIVQVERGCLISAYDSGTTHGSPYFYDRAVPLVFWGAGVDPGLFPSAARTIDIAPTLAGALAVPVPEGLDGARLF